MLKRLLDIWDGQIVAAVSLEAAVEGLDLLRPDTWIERLNAAALADFADIPQAFASLPDQRSEADQCLAARLGWIVDTLVNWDVNQERAQLKVEAALAAVPAWDHAGAFWPALRPHIQKHLRAMAAFEAVLRSRAPQAFVPDNTPIWEREELAFLQQAEENADWVELFDRAKTLCNFSRSDPSARSATLALALMDWPRIIRIADRSKSWFQAHVLLEPLSLEDTFYLATATRSGYVRFAALERVLNREMRFLTTTEENALRNFLIVLSKDKLEWPDWVSICNRNLIQHRYIQVALGQALARCGQTSIQDYVDSILLGTPDSGARAVITLCLREFRSQARSSVRLALWKAAFHRWERWDFGVNEDQSLNSIARSTLDYAVIGWLVEGQLRVSNEDLEQIFERQLRLLGVQWHRSFSSAISGFFRLMSRHQVLAHALGRSQSDPDWLPGPAIYVPAASADPFVQRRYKWDGS